MSDHDGLLETAITAARIGGETNYPVLVGGDLSVQSYGIETSGIGWNSYLRKGKALAIETAFREGRAVRREVMVVRYMGGSLRPRMTLPLAGGRGNVELYDLRSVRPTTVVARGSLVYGHETPYELLTRLDTSGEPRNETLVSYLRDGSLDAPDDLMSEEVLSLRRERFDDWLIVLPDEWSSADEEQRMRALAEQAQMASNFELLATDYAQDAIDVTLTLSRANGERIASASLPTLLGRSLSIALGNERIYHPDTEVEIAPKASAQRLMSGLLFDGLAVWMKASRGANGAIHLELRGGAHLVGTNEPYQVGNPSADGLLDQARRERLFTAERMRLEPVGGEGRRWVRQIGSLARGSQDLRLPTDIRQ